MKSREEIEKRFDDLLDNMGVRYDYGMPERTESLHEFTRRELKTFLFQELDSYGNMKVREVLEEIKDNSQATVQNGYTVYLVFDSLLKKLK